MTLILDWQRTGPRELRTTCGRYRVEKSETEPPIYTLFVQSGPEKWTRINWWAVADAAKSAASEHALRVKRESERARVEQAWKPNALDKPMTGGHGR